MRAWALAAPRSANFFRPSLQGSFLIAVAVVVRSDHVDHSRSMGILHRVSDYDPDMLANGPYPAWLKEWIAGPAGHVANFEAAELLQTAASRRMRWACLGHLSHDNNTPKLVLATHRKVPGARLPIHVATRYETTDVMHV